MRKKISKTKTPAIDQDSFLVGLMNKHNISYNQALRMSIEMDAEKGIADNSKWKLLQALEDEEMENMLDKDQISPEKIVEYTTTEGEIFNVLKLKKEMHRSTMLSSLLGLPIPTNLDACNVSDVTSQHPEILRLKKEIADRDKKLENQDKELENRDKQIVKEKLEKQKCKDIIAEQAYAAIKNNRLKAKNGSGSKPTQILWLMVDVYKKAVLESVDKERIYKDVFWGLKRFKKFELEMRKQFGKCFFPSKGSMEGYIRIAETELHHETNNEKYKPTDGRPTNKFKNYIPKYPEDIKPEPPKPSEPPNSKMDLDAMDEEILKDD
jgi:hypothetical protein